MAPGIMSAAITSQKHQFLNSFRIDPFYPGDIRPPQPSPGGAADGSPGWSAAERSGTRGTSGPHSQAPEGRRTVAPGGAQRSGAEPGEHPAPTDKPRRGGGGCHCLAPLPLPGGSGLALRFPEFCCAALGAAIRRGCHPPPRRLCRYLLLPGLRPGLRRCPRSAGVKRCVDIRCPDELPAESTTSQFANFLEKSEQSASFRAV
jgi:hypothetical protein